MPTHAQAKKFIPWGERRNSLKGTSNGVPTGRLAKLRSIHVPRDFLNSYQEGLKVLWCLVTSHNSAFIWQRFADGVSFLFANILLSLCGICSLSVWLPFSHALAAHMTTEGKGSEQFHAYRVSCHFCRSKVHKEGEGGRTCGNTAAQISYFASRFSYLSILHEGDMRYSYFPGRMNCTE